MKRIYLIILSFLSVAYAYAQTSLLATLSHEGSLTTYYGANALKDAYNASVQGDVITLSSGQFLATDINKAITIRGAGMQADSIGGALPTIISGNFNIKTESLEHPLVIEGVYNDYQILMAGSTNIQFIRCRLKTLSQSDNSTTMSISIIHCRISSGLTGRTPNVEVVNSVLYNPPTNGQYRNCNLIYTSIPGTIASNSLFYNCIFYLPSNNINYVLEKGNQVINSIAIGSNSTDLFKNISNITNKANVKNTIFRTFRGTYIDDEDFSLTDEAQREYLGNDGKQVGIYGGSLPYETIPSNPRITKFDVASKSTADGKLSVNIQVEIPE